MMVYYSLTARKGYKISNLFISRVLSPSRPYQALLSKANNRINNVDNFGDKTFPFRNKTLLLSPAENWYSLPAANNAQGTSGCDMIVKYNGRNIVVVI